MHEAGVRTCGSTQCAAPTPLAPFRLVFVEARDDADGLRDGGRIKRLARHV
jgi:hypothetical protein